MESTLIYELIKSVKNEKRPEKIEVPVYGQYNEEQRTFLYSDSEKKYEFKYKKPEKKEVRSVKAFSKAISEELKRRSNSTGDRATVIINMNGGEFIADDNFGEGIIKFKRLNSQQWEWLKHHINKTMEHREFLFMLRGLKPSFDEMGIDFNTFFAKYNQLKLVGQSKLVSNPIITADGQEEGYLCSYKLADGTDGEERFPTGFTVRLPFAKAGDFSYDIDIDLLFTRNEDDRIDITVLCPDFENIEEKAIIDEAEYIEDKTKDYTNLLILSDF